MVEALFSDTYAIPDLDNASVKKLLHEKELKRYELAIQQAEKVFQERIKLNKYSEVVIDDLAENLLHLKAKDEADRLRIRKDESVRRRIVCQIARIYLVMSDSL
jgi:biopolymer transport protein ExbD